MKDIILKYWQMRLPGKEIIEQLLEKHIDKDMYGLG
jgi:hypothetical protein